MIEGVYSGSSDNPNKVAGYVHSPGFGVEYQKNNTVFVYHVHNTNPCCVQLVFTDLDLDTSSSLKVSIVL